MGKRAKSNAKMESEDEGRGKLESVIFLSSSDDEDANRDLSLEIVEKAQQRESKRHKRADAEETAGRSFDTATVINLSSSSSDELEFGEGRAEPVMEDAVKKKKKRRRSKNNKTKKKLEGDLEKAEEPSETVTTVETEAMAMLCNAVETEEFLVIDEAACVGPVGTSDDVIRATKHFEIVENVEKEVNGVSDNAVLRKLLRGPRYFDPPDSHWGTCYNCGNEGHSVVNCTAQKRKKPCFVCGQFGHDAKHCTQGQSCYICKRRGHLAKDCPEKHQGGSRDYKLCLRCGGSGHDMSSCGNDYVADDLMAIQCYTCKNFGHLCCATIDTGPREVCCYSCGKSGHTGAGCAKSSGQINAAVSPTLCYKCGEEGHFARGCTKSTKSAQRMREPSTPTRRTSKEGRDLSGFRSEPHHLGKPHKRKTTFSDGRKSMMSRRSKWRGGWVADHPGDLPGRHGTANGWDHWTPMKNGWKVSPLEAGGHCSTSQSPFKKKHKILQGSAGLPFSRKNSRHKQFGRAYD